MKKFEDKEKAYCRSLKKNAIILQCINLDDPQDVKLQGYRYYILCKSQTWSTPESDLIKLEK